MHQDAEEGLASASKAAVETGTNIRKMEASVDSHRCAPPVPSTAFPEQHGLIARSKQQAPVNTANCTTGGVWGTLDARPHLKLLTEGHMQVN